MKAAYWKEGLASHVMRRRRALGIPNTALHIKHYVPACSEVERLRLIGASLDRADGAHRVCNAEPELLAAWPAAEAAMELASAPAAPLTLGQIVACGRNAPVRHLLLQGALAHSTWA